KPLAAGVAHLDVAYAAMLRKRFGDQALCAAAMPAPIGAELEQYRPRQRVDFNAFRLIVHVRSVTARRSKRSRGVLCQSNGFGQAKHDSLFRRAILFPGRRLAESWRSALRRRAQQPVDARADV